MDENRQDLICEVVGQISEDLDNLYPEGLMELLKNVPSEKLKEFLGKKSTSID
jgi:hypothetical protein